MPQTLKARIGLALLGVLVLIQFVPVDRSHSPVTGDLAAPAEVDAILRAACYDCHSHETQWPWYGYVAPVSWCLAHHVEEGREYLNFSTWDTLSARDTRYNLHEMIEEIEEGEMPLKPYRLLHGGARLSEAQVATLKAWVAEQVPE